MLLVLSLSSQTHPTFTTSVYHRHPPPPFRALDRAQHRVRVLIPSQRTRCSSEARHERHLGLPVLQRVRSCPWSFFPSFLTGIWSPWVQQGLQVRLSNFETDYGFLRRTQAELAHNSAPQSTSRLQYPPSRSQTATSTERRPPYRSNLVGRATESKTSDSSRAATLPSSPPPSSCSPHLSPSPLTIFGASKGFELAFQTLESTTGRLGHTSGRLLVSLGIRSTRSPQLVALSPASPLPTS